MDGLTLVHTHGGGQGRTVISAAFKESDAGRAVFSWLIAVALMVALMMLIGAITRLTESGLSMVEWRPLIGALPPLSEAEWYRVLTFIVRHRSIGSKMRV